MNKKPFLMLVEDSILYQQYLINLCKKHSYDYISVFDGIEAIEKLFTLRPDIILLDIQLPGMDGYSVCEQIRKMPSIHQVPIIFLTSNDKESDIVRGFEIGGNDYVTKPFNEVILYSRIKNQLEQVQSKYLLNDYIMKMESLNNALQIEKDHSELLASRDHLTGIYNRRYIQTTIMDMMTLNKSCALSFALALFDIDDFKSINDTYGHTTGDYVLKEVVSIIYRNVREEDILGRWGGEEFLLYMPYTNLEQALPILDYVRTEVENHIFTIDDSTFNITITCGLSQFVSTENYNSIFNRVDEALYDGKQTGKNRVVTK